MLETHAILRSLWEWITRQKHKPCKYHPGIPMAGPKHYPYCLACNGVRLEEACQKPKA